MTFYTILDENNFELFGVSLKQVPNQNYTTVLRTEFFVKAKFINDVWLEGATEEEINQYNQENII